MTVSRTLFEWLRERFPLPQLDIGFYEPNALYTRDAVIEVLQRIDNAVGAHELGVMQNGLGQLVAYWPPARFSRQSLGQRRPPRKPSPAATYRF